MTPALQRFLARLGFIRRDQLDVLLHGRELSQAGFVGIKAEAQLLVEMSGGGRRRVPFLIDSGATVSRISALDAQRYRFPLDRASPPIVLTERTAAGARRRTIRRGPIRVRLHPEQRAAPFVFPITYVEDAPTGVDPLLGLGGVISQLDWHFTGMPPSAFPDCGTCRLIDRRGARDRFPG